MPLTPEQERIRQLWAGNPLANRQLPQETQQPALSPASYNNPASSNPASSVTSAMPMLTETIANPTNYQDAVRRRFEQINGMGSDATQRAMSAAQMRQAQMAQQTAAQYNGEGYGDSKYIGMATGSAERDKLLKLVAAQKGMPYSWGGGNSKGPSYGLSGGGERHGSSQIYGFDCSGLVQYAYAQIGIKMPRLAGQQMAMGTRISMSQAKPGDLVGKPGHIAIYAGNGMMWEAPTFGKSVRLVPVRKGMFAVHVKGVG